MATEVLALNSYHGGSHRAFLDGWSRHSRHRFAALTLPPYKWKWRMRHAAVTFAEQVSRLVREGHGWDVLFCTDMLNLAEFRGLCPPQVCRLPTIAYFHENQLTYPSRHPDERDLHFAFTNMTTALAADRLWFNSAFHRDEFCEALRALLRRMPDYAPSHAVSEIDAKAEVHPPGIEAFPPRGRRPRGPLHILWVSRWEHDKGPDTFFQALYQLSALGVDFRLSVLGESFGQVSPCFDEARQRLGAHIHRWGYLPSREDYRAALAAADVVVSTAGHEFFGIAVVEAVAAGCFPLVPHRLAYPEVFGEVPDCFYDGTVPDLARRLLELGRRAVDGQLGQSAAQAAARMSRFAWSCVAPTLDTAVSETTGKAEEGDAAHIA
jgi:glycosyltransferase involved in cell wall biosynthesis